MHVRVEISAPGEPSASRSINGPSIMLGRDPACQLCFDGKVHSAVSWQHARIDLAPAGGSLTDLGSSNGTFLNGGQITSARPLQKGDVVSLGQTGPKIRILELATAAIPATVAEKMLPGGMLTPPRGTSPLNISSDSLPPRPRKRRSPVIGIVLGLLALAAVVAAGYVIFTGPTSNKTDNAEGKKDDKPIEVAVLPETKDVKDKGVKDPEPDPTGGKKDKIEPSVKPEKLPTSQELYRQTLKSTGWIIVPRPFGFMSTGTGALVDAEKRLFLTAAHVIDSGGKDAKDAKEIKVHFPKYEADLAIADRDHYLNKEVPVLADVVVSNRANDLAVLRLRSIPEGVAALPISKKSVSVADRVYTVGNPGASGALWVYTEGSVRQILKKTIRLNNGQSLKAWMIEAQFPINQGDSGGPVVSERVELVGVNSSREPNAQLISNCIDLREIRDILEQARAKDE